MMDLKKDILKWIIVILILLFLPYGSVLLVLAFIILFFKNNIYNSDLLLLYFLLFFIQNVAEGGGNSGLNNTRFLLIFVSFLKMVSQNGFSYNLLFRKAIYFPILIIFLVLHSIIFSYNMANSLVELVSFMALFFFTFQNTYFENIQQRSRILNSIEAMYIAIIALSIISFAIPSIAYARNGVGFQGVGNHPNAFGVVIAPYCGWMIIRLFQKFNSRDLALAFTSFIFLFLTQSRTSILSLLLGIIVIMIINKKLRILISRKTLILIMISSSLIIFNLNTLSDSIFNFLDKGNTGSVEESILSSRGSLIDKQTYNINNNPLFGIGFKTPSDFIIAENVFTIGKPYEKGNMILAVTEELGTIGFIILFITITSLLKLGSNRRTILLILPAVAIFTTMGEATLFSIGGIGVIIWAFIFLSFHNGMLIEKQNSAKKLK